jgi:hypothetical protein
MLKRMTAKFNGKCAMSGFPITKGDDIMFDTVSRKAYIMEHNDAMPVATPEHNNVIGEFVGNTFYVRQTA